MECVVKYSKRVVDVCGEKEWTLLRKEEMAASKSGASQFRSIIIAKDNTLGLAIEAALDQTYIR